MKIKATHINVAIVTDYMAPYRGNFFESVLKLEARISAIGGKMIFVFPEKAKGIGWVQELTDENKVIMFLPEQVIGKTRYLKQILSKEEINIIHSHFCLPKTQLAVKVISKLTNTKLVQHYHNHYTMNKKSLKEEIIKWSFNGDLNIGCSDSVTNSIPYKNKKSLPNAIRFERLEQYEDRFSFNNISKNTTVFLMLGFDYKRKGVDLAIRALKKIADTYLIQLKIVVSVRPEQIQQMIKNDFGYIPEWVEILPPREDIATYYRNSDVFLQVAREEGFCYALVEAIYCQVPCISSQISGVPNDIPGIDTFDLEDVQKLVEICETNIASPKSIEIKSKARQYVVAKYGIDKWVDNMIQYYLYL